MKPRPVRNLVTRADGKLVNVARKTGQLFVCAEGCCCGHTEHGFAVVLTDLYHEEWERRKLRPFVHLSMGGCLGPCPLANIAMLLFDGRSLWFHSMNTASRVIALYDYVEAMVQAQAYLPPPPALADLHFNAFNWAGDYPPPSPTRGDGTDSLPPPRRGSVGVGVEPVGATAVPQTQSGFVFLTHANTDLLALSKVVPLLGPDFPPVRAFNITHLRSEDDARAFIDAVTPSAEVLILRLHGGSQSFRGGFERIVERAAAEDQWLICLPGTDEIDPELTAASNVGAPIVHEAWAYLQFGGLKNVEHLLRFLSDHLLTSGFGYDAPEPQPRHGIYYRSSFPAATDGTAHGGTERTSVGILFYRSHLLSGNTAFVDALINECEGRGAAVTAVFTSSLQDLVRAPDQPVNDEGALPTALRYFQSGGLLTIDTLITTTSFAAGNWGARPHTGPLSEELGTVDTDPSQSGGPVGRGLVPRRAALRAILSTAHAESRAAGDKPPPYRSDGTDASALYMTGAPLVRAGEFTAPPSDSFVALGVPVVQAIASSGTREQWADSVRGLSPIDTAMNVAIPELDGRVISVPVSFKTSRPIAGTTESRSATVVIDAHTSAAGLAAENPKSQAPAENEPRTLYEAEPGRVARAVGLALALAALSRKPNAQKRIAFLLTDYSAKASRVAAAVGLDTPASLLRILEAMRELGYSVQDLPASGDVLIQRLIAGGTYDREVPATDRPETTSAMIPRARYESWFAELPEVRRSEMADRWGEPPGKHHVDATGSIALAGIEMGNAFVAIQPPRGYGMDPAAIYHTPDLPPPHPYFALYRWLAAPVDRGGWGADAMVHVGKHGTLEWLPGKGVGLSADCYPDLLLADLPLVYPFIVNDPGEGAQAKRRAHAVIIDHMTPPMTTAEGYGEIEELTRLVDEYYQLEQLDPTKLPYLQQQIWELIKRAGLDNDLGMLMNRDSETHTHAWDPQFHEDGVPYTISDLGARDFAHLVENMNGYLCELTSAQIRDGLHVLGQAPVGTQLVDTLLSLVRLPNLDVPSLRSGVAAWLGLDLDAILGDLSGRLHAPGGGERILRSAQNDRVGEPLWTHADALEEIDGVCRRLIEALAAHEFRGESIPAVSGAEAMAISGRSSRALQHIERTLRFVCDQLVPNLRKTDAEIVNLLKALDGQHVPAGPSGAPTRGMAQVLPTGRNFYTVDPRALPSESAWVVGQCLADSLLNRYLQDEGRYPETVGISIWGTSLMRTHGDDVAEVMALIGVQPRWQSESRRLVGFDVIRLQELGRPRVDVVCRISGFFRDAFPDLIALLDNAFRLIASLDEPFDQNPIRRHVLDQQRRIEEAGGETADAARRASYRLFGSPAGAYGAGILPLIDERNWHTDADLAEVYVNWGGYAYGADTQAVDARAEFRVALASVEAAVKNQDNREHDIFDSDDYFQYHGGMIAAIRSFAGANPRRYFGDSADPQRAKVRDLKEEALRVFRSRVVNPKWISSIQRHGYKGALELAATVDYIFGYDATSNVVDDWMYERLAAAYALNPDMQRFFRDHNPWALRDVAARLIEAMDRALWKDPTPEMRAAIQSAYLAAEADIEAGGARQAGHQILLGER